jgi:hypothetical protein
MDDMSGPFVFAAKFACRSQSRELEHLSIQARFEANVTAQVRRARRQLRTMKQREPRAAYSAAARRYSVVRLSIFLG